MENDLFQKSNERLIRLDPRTGLIFSIGLLVIFIAAAVAHFTLPNLDKQAEIWFFSRTTPMGHWIFNKITWMGETILIVPISLILLSWWALKKQWLIASGLLISVFFGGFLTFLFKIIFHAQRPFTSTVSIRNLDFGFPSGHAMMSMLFFGFLAYVLIRRIGNTHYQMIIAACAGLITFLVGMSRLFLGVHYPTDVMGGWSLGAAWLILSILIIEQLSKRRQFAPKIKQHAPVLG